MLIIGNKYAKRILAKRSIPDLIQKICIDIRLSGHQYLIIDLSSLDVLTTNKLLPYLFGELKYLSRTYKPVRDLNIFLYHTYDISNEISLMNINFILTINI